MQVKLTASYVNRADLRRAAIHLLQSMLALPLHFANMPIKVSFPSILRHSGIWGAADETVFNIVHKKIKNKKCYIASSVPDLWHFGVDPDPDPRIHDSD